MSRLYVALLFVFATVVSSVAVEQKFEPGELLVGYVTSGDRDAALKRLTETKDVLRVRGERLVNVEILPVADKAVKLHLTFPPPVLNATRNNPSEEIAVLQDVAKQIKEADHSVEYAHPNWIAVAKISLQSDSPDQQASRSLQLKKPVPHASHHARRHIAKTYRLASHRRHHAAVVAWERRHHRHHAAVVAWERRHRRAKERRWSDGFCWPFSFAPHCWNETWMHAQRHHAFSKHPRSALR